MHKYNGVFNWAGESYSLWTWASSEEVAFKNFLHKLKGETQQPLNRLRMRFNGQIDNFFIRRIPCATQDDAEMS
jgi:hypothetical protein